MAYTRDINYSPQQSHFAYVTENSGPKTTEHTMPSQDNVIKKLTRFYLFYGPNSYRVDDKLSSLIKAVISPGSEAFDLDRFSGKSSDISNVINAVSTPPIISPLRVIVFTDVEHLSAGAQTRLDSFLPKIPEYSVLAMTAVKLDKRSKLFKKLAEAIGHTHLYDLYKPDEAMALVIKFAGDRGKKIAIAAAGALVDLFGTDPYRLQNEVEKLALFVGDKPEISSSDLAFASGFTRVETAYDLPRLIMAGKPDEALELVRNAIASGIAEMQMLYILKNHVMGLNAARKAGNIKNLMGMIRMPMEPARQLLAVSAKLSQDSINKGLTAIFRAEYSLKSARFPSEAVMELLVVTLYLVLRGNIPKDKMYLL
jgi:DNA polymerase III subunit delta